MIRMLLAAAICLLLSPSAALADLIVDEPPNPVLVGAGIALCIAVVFFGLYLFKRQKTRKTQASSSEESDTK